MTDVPDDDESRRRLNSGHAVLANLCFYMSIAGQVLSRLTEEEFRAVTRAEREAAIEPGPEQETAQVMVGVYHFLRTGRRQEP